MFRTHNPESIFRDTTDHQVRKKQSQDIIEKYPTKIPIILSSTSLTLNRTKFLVPDEMIVLQFHHYIRKTLMLTDGQAIFTYVSDIDPKSEETLNCTLPHTRSSFCELYKTYIHTDGFLYMQAESENTFG